MDSSITSTESEKAQEPQIEIPVLPECSRSETLDPAAPTIARDFAYSADNPLFWRLHDTDATDDPIAEPDTATETSNMVEEEETAEGSGFTGAPPWMRSGGQDDLLEEDNATLAADDELHGRAQALFDFTPEHENEFALQEGQVIYISSRHGLGWLVAVDIESGDCGLVPEEYVRLLNEEDEGFYDEDEADKTIHTDREDFQDKLNNDTEAGKRQEHADEWEDEPDQTAQQEAKQASLATSDGEKKPEEWTDEERQKIMDAAEREMQLMEARLRDS